MDLYEIVFLTYIFHPTHLFLIGQHTFENALFVIQFLFSRIFQPLEKMGEISARSPSKRPESLSKTTSEDDIRDMKVVKWLVVALSQTE